MKLNIADIIKYGKREKFPVLDGEYNTLELDASKRDNNKIIVPKTDTTTKLLILKLLNI